MFHEADFIPSSYREDGNLISRFASKFFHRGLLLRGCLAAAVGALLGIAVSMIVNVSLVEVSLSPFFALVSI